MEFDTWQMNKPWPELRFFLYQLLHLIEAPPLRVQ